MDRSHGDSAALYALRLGLDSARVSSFRLPVTIEPATLVIRSTAEPAPLIICLHPARMTEFQFAHALRGLVALRAHLAFPRGLHAHEVDLGGAQTVGYAWFHYTGDNPAFRESLAQADAYLSRVLERLLLDLPVDRRAIFVLGAGDGASLAAAHANAHAERIAGVVAIGSRLRLETLAQAGESARRLPILRLTDRRKRTAREVSPEVRSAELHELGFAVDLEEIRTSQDSWNEEEGAVIAWLTQKAGIGIQVPG
ncbi:MAG: hypothetical protein GF330_10280 [Candidatus Eisenbacteria bacterium]|nr:hypothetical protein [Candidatus Eisenbacteria bacterium]